MNQQDADTAAFGEADLNVPDGNILQRIDPDTVRKIQQVIDDQIEVLVQTIPSYQALWTVLGNYDLHEAARTRCSFLLAKSVFAAQSLVRNVDLALLRRVVTSGVKYETLELISAIAHESKGPTIAFFLPTRAFSGHFGNLPQELRDRGFQVLQFFGTYQGREQFKTRGSFLLIDDMISLINGVDGFVTAQILDCLPQKSKKILIDHLSFVNFNLGRAATKAVAADKTADIVDGLDGGALVEKFTAFPVFFPMFDVHVTASHVLTDNIDRIAKTYGYRDISKQSNCDPELIKPHAKPVLAYLGKERISKSPIAITGGYPKFDDVCARSASAKPENIITYAPTPNDKGGNKTGPQWQDFMSINSHGAEIVAALCQAFPEYRIVFKPHAEEFGDVVDRIANVGTDFNNFELSQTGSEYWDLYLKTKILVSDFSSTAYTFAIGTKRPVVFFSKNEDRLRDHIDEVRYCYYRLSVGEVVQTSPELCTSIESITSNYDSYLERVEDFVNENCVNLGNAASEIADHLADYFAGKRRDEWRVFQMDKLPSGEPLT